MELSGSTTETSTELLPPVTPTASEDVGESQRPSDKNKEPYRVEQVYIHLFMHIHNTYWVGIILIGAHLSLSN